MRFVIGEGVGTPFARCVLDADGVTRVVSAGSAGSIGAWLAFSLPVSLRSGPCLAAQQ
jgi:hypothetical protein